LRILPSGAREFRMLITVYLKLRNEATDVWRPVKAEPVGPDQYRIVSQPIEDENWPVAQNEIVQCERQMLSGGECLVVKAS
jgi:hypothetical protein